MAVAKDGPGISSGRTAEAMDVYWRDIQHYRPLSRQKEAELAGRARAGDEEAYHALVNANLRFVVSVARDYAHCGLSFIELVSEGNCGLIEAVKRFDERLGYKFITYAVWWIRQAILKALAQQGKAARPPMSRVNDLQEVERQAAALSQRLGRSPTLAEVADSAAMSEERARQAVELAQRDVSFDTPAYAGDDDTLLSVFLGEEPAPDSELERVELARTLRRALAELDVREQQIVRAYFGLGAREPMTLEQVGATLGLTRERVRQLRDRALGKIRAGWGSVLLELSRN